MEEGRGGRKEGKRQDKKEEREQEGRVRKEGREGKMLIHREK